MTDEPTLDDRAIRILYVLRAPDKPPAPHLECAEVAVPSGLAPMEARRAYEDVLGALAGMGWIEVSVAGVASTDALWTAVERAAQSVGGWLAWYQDTEAIDVDPEDFPELAGGRADLMRLAYERAPHRAVAVSLDPAVTLHSEPWFENGISSFGVAALGLGMTVIGPLLAAGAVLWAPVALVRDGLRHLTRRTR